MRQSISWCERQEIIKWKSQWSFQSCIEKILITKQKLIKNPRVIVRIFLYTWEFSVMRCGKHYHPNKCISFWLVYTNVANYFFPCNAMVAMGLSSHIGSHIELWTCFLFLAKLFWYYWVVCHINLIDLFAKNWTCLSNFCVNDSLVICKWGLPEETFRRGIFLLCCCYFSILKYYIYPKNFSSIRKNRCSWKRYVKEIQISNLKEFWLYLKICQIC